MRYILSLHPDVVCLQEVSRLNKQWLSTIPGYTINSCIESKHNHPLEKHMYILIMTKQKPIFVKKFKYDYAHHNSILTRLYAAFVHFEEMHHVIAVRLKVKGKQIQITNTRLSCAIGTSDRVQEFKTLVRKVKHKTIPTIYCGDYNVVDSKLFNRLTGWLRGFTRFDYLLDERASFEKLFKKEHLVNIFRGKSTSFVNRPLLQLDHILVPKTFLVQSHLLTKKRYGSDHRILVATIQI
ncbi:MAG: hypothetical protein UU25_C0024G0005 [Microgenomates group bacterium GW2011_GWB1_40_9]|nr:MAG: hypothetical protein UT26_C0028G0005 [Microgenomates group bacterium GW2011_GWC1_39_12]KKR79013.1 MAG: hypothetical protein UU25_C0024G0005 [Microgenomates group bacterium GW2011_GWB1_40_9]